MIDPDYLLWAPHDQLSDPGSGAPNQTFLRRAVSNFYYALFHEVCRKVADLHVGSTRRRDPRWVMIYRSIEHGKAREVMRQIASERTSSNEARTLAATFGTLQEARHQADYNPAVRFRLADVRGLFLDAESAIDNLRNGFVDRDLILTRVLSRGR